MKQRAGSSDASLLSNTLRHVTEGVSHCCSGIRCGAGIPTFALFAGANGLIGGVGKSCLTGTAQAPFGRRIEAEAWQRNLFRTCGSRAMIRRSRTRTASSWRWTSVPQSPQSSQPADLDYPQGRQVVLEILDTAGTEQFSQWLSSQPIEHSLLRLLTLQ